MARTVFYVEDDENIAQIVAEYLAQRNFTVTVLPTVAQARAAFGRQKPDLCLIDWNMPDGRGEHLCQFIRSRWQELPVIFLTVRSDASDIVAGFGYGADDYVVKPFELEVLYARIQALLRRIEGKSDQMLCCGGISMNQSKKTVFYKDEEIALSQMEYQLLSALLRHKGATVQRDQLLREIWDSNGSFVNDNTLTVTMKRLREKLHHPKCLKTVRSFGYRMEEL